MQSTSAKTDKLLINRSQFTIKKTDQLLLIRVGRVFKLLTISGLLSAIKNKGGAVV